MELGLISTICFYFCLILFLFTPKYFCFSFSSSSCICSKSIFVVGITLYKVYLGSNYNFCCVDTLDCVVFPIGLKLFVCPLTLEYY